MHASEESLPDLQRDFYMRAESELSRYYDMLKTAKRGTLTDKQVNLFIATIAVLDLEAKTLKVSVPAPPFESLDWSGAQPAE